MTFHSAVTQDSKSDGQWHFSRSWLWQWTVQVLDLHSQMRVWKLKRSDNVTKNSPLNPLLGDFFQKNYLPRCRDKG